MRFPPSLNLFFFLLLSSREITTTQVDVHLTILHIGKILAQI